MKLSRTASNVHNGPKHAAPAEPGDLLTLARPRAERPRLLVERVAHCVVVSADAGFTERFRAADMVPVEPAMLPIVVDPDVMSDVDDLHPALLDDLYRQLPVGPARRRGGLRLLVDGAARPRDDGRAPLASMLSRSLEVDVVAPSGRVVFPRPGHVFSAGDGGGWRTFVDGSEAAFAGPRHPAPGWQAALPSAGSLFRAPGSSVQAIPAGLWLRAGRPATGELPESVLGFPQSRDRLAVLVGEPGETQPTADDVCRLLSSLAPALEGRTVLMPYGDRTGDLPLGQEIADRFGRDVLAAHVLPREAPTGQAEFSATGADGSPTWQPYVAVSRYRRGQRPQPWWWTAPLPELRIGQDALCALTEGWVLELVPSGILVRPHKAPFPVEAYHRPVDPEAIEVIFADFPGSTAALPDAVLRAVRTLLSRLPSSDRRLLRPVSPAAHLQSQVDRLTEWLLDPGAGTPVPPPAAVPSGTVVQRAAATTAPAGPPPEPQAGPAEAVRERAAVVVTADGRIWPPASTPRPVRIPATPAETTPNRVSLKRTGLSHAVPRVPDLPRTPVPTIADVLAGATANGTTYAGAPAVAPEDYCPVEPVEPAPLPAPGHPAEQLPPFVLSSANGSGPFPASGHKPQPAPPAEAPAPAPQPAPATPPAPQAPAAGHTPPPAPPAKPSAPVPQAAPPAKAPAPAPQPAAAAEPRPQQPHPPKLRPLRIGPDTVLPAERSSTPEERAEFRSALGWRYDAAARFVTKLLSARPGLRGDSGDDAVVPELAATHLFALTDPAEFAIALRAGSVPAEERALLSCAIAGLRRLPSFTGPVLRPVPDGLDLAGLYRKADELLEPASLPAHSDLTRAPAGTGELIVWSSTARHLDGLAGDEPTDLVSFQPGTVFRVLEVDTSAAVTRVLLAETPASWIGRPDERRDERILARLRAAVEARAAANTSATAGKIAPDLLLGMLPGEASR